MIVLLKEDIYMKSKQKYSLIIILMLIISTSLYGCTKEVAAEYEEIIKPAKVQVVTTENYSKDIEISGNVKPAQLVRTGFKLAGVIDRINVKEGDTISKGQVIATLETDDYQLGVNAAQAQYDAVERQADSAIRSGVNQAEANLEFVKTQYERMEKLYEEGAIPKTTLEELETQLVVAESKYQEALDAYSITEAQLKQAGTGIEAAENKIKDTVLKSPISGTVIQKLFEEGETIASGHPVVVLGRLDVLEVEIGVPDILIDSIQIGKNVDVYIYGLEKEVQGRISNINTAADLETRTFGVKIDIANSENRIKPGMIAKVIMNTDNINTIMVPTNAVMNDPDGGKIFVYKEDGHVEERRITLGKVYDDKIQVLEGLEDGDQIVVEGHYKLVDMDKVKVEVVDND